MKRKFQFHIISMSTYGFGLSGGDRIWIELAKKISRNYPVSIYVWEEGLAIAKREGLKGVDYVLWSARSFARYGFVFNYFTRVVIGIIKAIHLKLSNSPETVIYSASEFWQDTIPALILKFRYSEIRWVAAWYQTAPNPLRGFSEGERNSKYRFKAFLYWFVQQPIKPFIEKYADLVLVNNEDEKKEFPNLTQKNKVMVMFGAVDLEKINIYKARHLKVKKNFDGVFQGRFHPQKGVVELIDIWRLVANLRPKAKLVMIGDGPLMDEVKQRIKERRLEKNIELKGYVFDGEKKYKIFSESRVVVHPAFYDSGGMAAAEAMAFGLPVVGFDLAAYKSYYPEGMVKVRVGDLEGFSKEVVRLLEDKKYFRKIAFKGLGTMQSHWSWDSRTESFLESLSS